MRIITRTVYNAIVQADEDDTRLPGTVVTFDIDFDRLGNPAAYTIVDWEHSGTRPSSGDIIRLGSLASEFLHNVLVGLHS